MSTPLTPGPQKRGRFAAFDGLAAWQAVLCFLPMALLFIGGAIGGALGGGAMALNLKVAKSQLGTPAKALSMVGIALAALLLFVVVAGALGTALRH